MRYTVLIADDSKLQRVIVKENLKDIYDVAEASGGQECLDLVEHAAPQPEAEPQKQPKPKSTSQKPEQPPVPCICARCNQPIKRVKLKDGSIMQAAEFAATHEGMCADCYKATRLNVA